MNNILRLLLLVVCLRIVTLNRSARVLHSQQTTDLSTPAGSMRPILTNEHLGCLIHMPSVMNETKKAGSANPPKTVLEHFVATKCGRLKRNWLHNPPLSDYAKQIEAHQSNCSLPLATHHFDNTFGFGSHLVLWGQAMCNGMEARYRMRSHAPEWIWLDHEHCNPKVAASSPTLCYFPASEYKCSDNTVQQTGSDPETENDSLIVANESGRNDVTTSINVTDPRKVKKWCSSVKESEESKAMVRASSTEYLFQRVSPLVIREANRQIGLIFPDGVVPEDLLTVHIRWGDKFWEMDLPPIQEYIDAANAILAGKTKLENNTSTNITHSSIPNATTANIYLATEDPKAYNAFMEAKPEGWKVYADITLLEIDAFRPTRGNRASWAARNTNGRAGLIALASLLVAMEANMFVLTTKSNWSTLMNHLRTNIVDPRCGNCTKMIDLRPGIW